MKRFLKALFGGGNGDHRFRGDTSVDYWREDGGTWNWHCIDGNNAVVCQSTQGYTSESACKEGIANAQDAMANAVVRKRTLA